MSFDQSNIPPRIADDLLKGAAAIADEIGETRQNVYYLAAQGLLPITRRGKILYALKSELRAAYSANPDRAAS